MRTLITGLAVAVLIAASLQPFARAAPDVSPATSAHDADVRLVVPVSPVTLADSTLIFALEANLALVDVPAITAMATAAVVNARPDLIAETAADAAYRQPARTTSTLRHARDRPRST